jgi:UDP-N-acetylmuramate dehydrogenase
MGEGLLDKGYFVQLMIDIVGSENVKTDEPMKNHTSFKIGGCADLMVIPDSIDSLSKVVIRCIKEKVPVYIIGNGTNIIVRDKGIRGVVIKILNLLCNYSVEDDIIKAEAGILLSVVSKIALENELTGLEFAEGIPGTLGGAVFMNAGAYTGEMKDVVFKTEYLTALGEKDTLCCDQHQFGYRTSIIQKEGGIVLKSELKLKKGSKYEIKSLMEEYNRKRKDKQPLEMPSAGSVFKRPYGYFTGKLVQDCGLMGYRIGGAEVSSKHCGFIVNSGNATANDVINLIEYVQNNVKTKFGVDLQTEVRIIGQE